MPGKTRHRTPERQALQWPAMLRRRRTSALGGLFLIALLALAPLQASHGALNILWRYSVLSWDNPASLALDGLAGASAPSTDPAGEALAHTRTADVETGRLAPAREADGRPSPALASGITRSPPAE